MVKIFIFLTIWISLIAIDSLTIRYNLLYQIVNYSDIDIIEFNWSINDHKNLYLVLINHINFQLTILINHKNLWLKY